MYEYRLAARAKAKNGDVQLLYFETCKGEPFHSEEELKEKVPENSIKFMAKSRGFKEVIGWWIEKREVGEWK